VKIVRAAIAAALALVAAGAIQMATSSGASAAVLPDDCGACWFVNGH
jgi:hypothetical protein